MKLVCPLVWKMDNLLLSFSPRSFGVEQEKLYFGEFSPIFCSTDEYCLTIDIVLLA